MTIRGKWAWGIVAALVVSLGLNIFTLGTFAAWRHFGPHHLGSGVEHVMDRETARAARPYLRAAFRSNREEIRARGKAVREARRAVAGTLRAPALDDAVLAAQLRALQDATSASQTAFQGVLIEAARAMPDELRQKVDWRFVGRRGRHRMDGEGRGPRGPRHSE